MNVFELAATITLNSSDYERQLGNAQKKSANVASNIGTGLKKAAKVGAAAFGVISGAAAAFSGVVIKNVNDVTDYGDKVDKMSQKMGLSSKAYQEWDAIMQHCGTTIDALKPSIKTLSAAAEKNSEAFQELGISQEEVRNLSQEELFSRTITELQKMEEGTKRTYLTSQLLGRGSTELGALLNKSAEDTQKMREEVNKLGGVMDDKGVKASAKFKDNIQDLKTAFSGLKRVITLTVLPSMNSYVESITKGMSGVIEKAQSGELIEAMGLFGEKIASFLTKGLGELPKLTGYATSLVSSFITNVFSENTFKSIGKFFEKFVSQTGDLLKKSIPAILKSLPAVVGVVFTTLRSLLNEVSSLLPTLIPQLVDTIINVFNTALDNLPQLIEAVLNVVTTLIDTVTSEEVLNKIVDGVVTLINTFVKMITDDDILVKITNAGIEIFTALNSALPVIIEAIVGAIPEIVVALVNMITDPETRAKMVTAGVELFVAIIGNLPEIQYQLKLAVPKIVIGLFEEFTKPEQIQRMTEIGPKYIEGLWEGMSSSFGWLWDKVSGFMDKFTNDIKAFFGIHSPSRLFRDEIGKNLALGIGEGFLAEIGKVADMMTNGIPDIEVDTQGVFTPTSNYSVDPITGKSTTVSQNIEIVINNPQIRDDSDINLLANQISERLGHAFMEREVAYG